ncbi:hypothetical protein MLD38_025946 [Melastoma candidum]|uniref:Uncharacterized protein n=1 Tax=Melastoma candidum TaxID=119954 RepID=A0ACB9NXX4_9MYRT|nr:hypothetical protein MLD38_025946 [Melastoma candidum]
MGRRPCCDQPGIKKGPWMPEEDIILLSYVQQHGPRNWRSVPANTGLLRCSKSCRLRWTNYLRPGIKRGNFTPHEEELIIHLQALLGNKWAAIASYLPKRTDNDIKNYWNTHLKKKLKKSLPGATTVVERAKEPGLSIEASQGSLKDDENKDNDRKLLLTARRTSPPASSSVASNYGNKLARPTSATYTSSAKNISKLLEGWMRCPPKSNPNSSGGNSQGPTKDEECNKGDDLMSQEELESMMKLKDAKDVPRDGNRKGMANCIEDNESKSAIGKEQKAKGEQLPLSFLEKWLLDESVGEEMMKLPSII